MAQRSCTTRAGVFVARTIVLLSRVSVLPRRRTAIAGHHRCEAKRVHCARLPHASARDEPLSAAEGSGLVSRVEVSFSFAALDEQRTPRHTPSFVKVREVIARLEDDGWQLVRTRGSHRQFRHPSKTGTVTVAGKPSVDVPAGTLASIWKQAAISKP